jgi:hypothetical protein
MCRRYLIGFLLALTVIGSPVLAATPAFAGGGDALDQCFGPGPLTQEEAQMTCVKTGDGEWHAEGGPGGGSGLGSFVLLGLFLALLPAIVGMTVAGSQGMSSGFGFAVGLFFSWLGVIGLFLYGVSQTSKAEASAESVDPETRLQKLQHLLDQGLITQQEYDTRRAAAVESL